MKVRRAKTELPIDWLPPLHKTWENMRSNCIKGFALRLKEVKMLAFSLSFFFFLRVCDFINNPLAKSENTD